MATLTIRNLPDSVRDALRVRAAKNGRSMEAEARAMIADGLADGAPRSVSPEVLERVRKAQALVLEALGSGASSMADELAADRRAEARRNARE